MHPFCIQGFMRSAPPVATLPPVLPSNEALVNRIRVLMIAMPRLQIDIIQAALANEPAVELVGDVPGDAADGALAATGADVAILGDGDEPPLTPLGLLDGHPRLKVLSVSGTGGTAMLYEYRPVVTRLGEASPRALVDAILRVAGPGGTKAQP
jgi:hypothetical protein